MIHASISPKPRCQGRLPTIKSIQDVMPGETFRTDDQSARRSAASVP